MVTARLIADLNKNEVDSNQKLNNSLRLLAKWRSELIKNTILKNNGTKVLDGPVKGLDFLERSAEGCHVAKLLGCYEQPLHEKLMGVLAGNYDKIINIGSAEGYYAVGLAVAAPGVVSLAYDIDLNAQAACNELASRNGVSDRVIVGGEFKKEDFQHHTDGSVLVLCDIEGAEVELLDPSNAPALKAMDLIVESHECLKEGVTETLIKRFSDTHNIELIEDNGGRDLTNAPSWFARLSHLDQLLATWEWRSGPTPWMSMTAKTE
ncbi:MAG: hypothetical protein CMQ07_00900 [Gammaproteobacteria bacterium]|nr:hypothetical protein [Gammaproteobacteria bacterium]